MKEPVTRDWRPTDVNVSTFCQSIIGVAYHFLHGGFINERTLRGGRIQARAALRAATLATSLLVNCVAMSLWTMIRFAQVKLVSKQYCVLSITYQTQVYPVQ